MYGGVDEAGGCVGGGRRECGQAPRASGDEEIGSRGILWMNRGTGGNLRRGICKAKKEYSTRPGKNLQEGHG